MKTPQARARAARQRLAAALIPEPGPRPRGKSAEAWEWARAVHAAVFSADPAAAQVLADEAHLLLRAPRPLPEPVRRWLQFVLAALVQSDALPRAHFGRPVDPRRAHRLRHRLARRLIARRAERPRESIDVAIEHVVAEVARELREPHRKLRALCDEAAFRAQVNELDASGKVARLLR